MDQDDSVSGHNHCRTCYRTDCSAFSECRVVPCEMGCGARFHACKREDHRDACELEKVQCINFVNGCPLLIQRNQLGCHLECCPASVVYCTMEWNRWPVYSHERQSRVPFMADNLHAQYGQLDVALALRDQRMLDQAMKAPRSTRRALRNNLTQRFPAVPIRLNASTAAEALSDGAASGASSDSGEYTNHRETEYPPGLQRSVCNALFKANRNAVENLTAPSAPLAAAAIVGLEANGQPSPMILPDDIEFIDAGVGHNYNKAETLHSTLPSNGNSNVFNPEESSTISSNIDLDATHLAAQNKHYALSTSMQYDIGVENTDGVLFSSAQHDEPEEIVNNCSADSQKVQVVPKPPCCAPMKPVKETLALDMNLESITRYQAKPKSMYTFLCAQEFRRDEYQSHFKNVHDEIHSGLNGWLEQRCPLAHYGCTYSFRRLYAGEKGAEIVHNSILESFGVKPHLPSHQQDKCVGALHSHPLNKTKASSTSSMTSSTILSKSSKSPSKFQLSNNADLECNGNISIENFNGKNEIEEGVKEAHADFNSLPFEVLRYMGRFLDGYSLCNLAVTSRLLRDVACSLLEEKGIVIQQWERRIVNGQTSWEISHKRWIFSTAFSPIKKWGFEDYPPLGEHLKTCPFYHRVRPTAPHYLPNMKCGRHHSDSFCGVMRHMYPDFTANRDAHNLQCDADVGLC